MFGEYTITIIRPSISRNEMGATIPLALVLRLSIYTHLHLLAPLSEESRGQSFAGQRF
jgi:hypothetical protein